MLLLVVLLLMLLIPRLMMLLLIMVSMLMIVAMKLTDMMWRSVPQRPAKPTLTTTSSSWATCH